MRPGLILVLVIAATLAACGSRVEAPELPGLALGATAEAQTAFRPLLKRWSNALTREERAAVASDLSAFLARFPGDGLGPAAEALLGWVAVERGDLTQGRKLSRRAANLGAGSWQDFATLLEGAILRRRGDPTGALETLKPLVSKLIDPWARDLLNEELIAAALAAPDAALAVKMMSVWLREANDDERPLVRSRVERALAALGAAELEKIFDERATLKTAGSDGEIDLLLAQRVAAIAIAAKDAVLAKKLLLTSGAALGDRGDAIARLAAGAAAIRVDARTVGVLLSFRTAETRRRSAEMIAGVAWGLELPGSAARLAVRDDAGELSGIEDALTDLGRDGAAVVIAGVAEEDARIAAAFAEEQHVPVILITRPEDLARMATLGELVEMGGAGAGAGAASGVVAGGVGASGVGAGGAASGVGAGGAASGGVPSAGGGAAGAAAPAGVSGARGAATSNAAAGAAGASNGATATAATATAATSNAATPTAAISNAATSAAGAIPAPSAPGGGVESFVFPLSASAQAWRAPPDSVLAPWIGAHGTPPSFWAAAGRDAAVRALRSVRDLPQAATEDRAEVEARRRTVRAALGQPIAGVMWTIEPKGPVLSPSPNVAP